jgi:hypothetical protein
MALQETPRSLAIPRGKYWAWISIRVSEWMVSILAVTATLSSCHSVYL